MIEKVMENKDIAREYWKQELEQYIYCLNDETNVDDDMLEEMVDDLMCDSDLWNTLDEIFSYHLYQVINRRK